MKNSALLYLYFVLLETLAFGSNGFLGYLRCQSSLVMPAKARSPECEALAEEGSCAFFDCFEERFPCGVCGFAANMEFNFCNQFFNPRNFNDFDEQGQRWIISAHQCLTRVMRDMYIQDSMRCGLNRWTMINSLSSCYRNNSEVSFCDIFQSNRFAFVRMYRRRNLSDMQRAASTVIGLGEICGFGTEEELAFPIHK